MRGASSDEGGVSDPFGMSGLMNFGNETTEMNDKMYQKIAEAERIAREKQKQKQLEEENKMNQTASSGFGKFISKRRQSRSNTRVCNNFPSPSFVLHEQQHKRWQGCSFCMTNS